MPSALALCLLAMLTMSCSAPADSLRYDPAEQTSRTALLAKRQTTRAYDGAPPTIPHQTSVLGRKDCNSCHTPGAATNGDRIGPPRSHPAWGDCRQCHLQQHAGGRVPGNQFEPLWRPARGNRLYAAAPPTIPHQLQNRQDCAVCHIGEQAPAALRAAHGMRVNCVQCHAAGAVEPL